MSVNYVCVLLEVGGGRGSHTTTEPHAIENKDGWSKINQYLTVIKFYARDY
jgi:hypothetical protein